MNEKKSFKYVFEINGRPLIQAIILLDLIEKILYTNLMDTLHVLFCNQ